ncbi:paired domain-containing protein [Trichonephila clavipes]|nr:paired domain-containing protein [Trichonephila clavipes]
MFLNILLSLYFELCVFDNIEKKVCYFRVVSGRKTTIRLLNVPRQTLSDAICHFNELGNDGRRLESGRKRTVNSSRNRKAIEKRVQRNPRFSVRQIARDMGISDILVRRIAKTEFELKPYKLRKV